MFRQRMDLRKAPVQKGFSLIEVMVALVILSIAIAAMSQTIGFYVNSTGRKQDAILAQWVAMNKITALRLQRNWPNTGRANGVIEYAKRKWYWETEIKNTPDRDVRRLIIRVVDEKKKDSGQYMSTMIAFLGKPVV